MSNPPLALIDWPVTHRLSSLASHATICAISSNVPSRFSIGVSFFCMSTRSFGMLFNMSLCTGPGFTVLIVMPLAPSSAAQHLDNPSRAALDEQYNDKFLKPCRAPTEPILTTRPDVCKWGRMCWRSNTGARTFRWYMKSKSSRVTSCRPLTSSAPALLTSMSILSPNAVTVCSTTLPTLSGSLKSACIPTQLEWVSRLSISATKSLTAVALFGETYVTATYNAERLAIRPSTFWKQSLKSEVTCHCTSACKLQRNASTNASRSTSDDGHFA